MSWSYQSSKPCTVLVKEKPDSHQVDCSPSIQSSTNRPNQDSPAEHQQDSVVSSVGNIVGGKRKKRQVLDVVVDGDGHEEVVESVEKRILVNISIGMDKGLGTARQEVYNLQVAVPLKSEEKSMKDSYIYKVHESEEDDFDVFSNFTNQSTEKINILLPNFDDLLQDDESTTEASGFEFIPISTSGLNHKHRTSSETNGSIDEFAFSSSHTSETNVN